MASDGDARVVIPRGQGRAFIVEAQKVIRLTQSAPGGQVADVAVFSRDNPHERLWGPKTAWEFGAHLTTGASLLSTGPWERRLMTIVADTLTRKPTARGALFHDVLGGCCSSKSHVRRYGMAETVPGCFEALTGALASFEVPPDFVHDTFNPFMRTGIVDNRLFHEPSDAVEGDYIELRADMTVLVAISCCQGRSSKPESTGLFVDIGG